MKPKNPNYHIIAAFVMMTRLASAAITFESGEGYSNGTIATVNGSGSNAPYDGQQSWSRSTSTGTGGIFTTTSSGEYVGGKALSGGVSSGAETYIGGKTGIIETNVSNTITFDFRINSANATVSAGFLGNDGDSLFDLSSVDNGMQFGITAGQIYLRNQAFGTNVNLVDILEVVGNWYHIAVTIGADISSNRSISISLRDLTTGTDIDLNGVSAGNNYTSSVTSANFGIAPESAVGGFVRITQDGSSNNDGNRSAIDNLTFTAVPEPSSLALLAASGLCLLRRRRS
jgi:PEP-CTERM motif